MMPLLGTALRLGGRDLLALCASLVVVCLLALALATLSLLSFIDGPGPLAVPVGAASGSVVGPFLSSPTLGDTRWGSGTDTYCELYVEQRVGWGNQGVSAAAAAQRLAGLGVLHPGWPPKPAVVIYFAPAPDNGGSGHVGIYDGDGRFTSVTSWGVQERPMAGWQAPYLGWVDPIEVHSDRFGYPVSPGR